jgi:peptidoglycan hydrolase CwlO-like protein
MNKSENISNLLKEKEAFQTEVFHWKAEILKSTNKEYIKRVLETIKQYENSIEQIERKVNEIRNPISSPYNHDGI